MESLVYSPPLTKGDIFVIDGGLSDQLKNYVSGVDEDPLWTARSLLTQPDSVKQVHIDYINAGARIILTDSYQISETGWKEHLGLDSSSTKDAVVKSVELAKSAIGECGKAPGYILIGGSVGPYGACLADGSEYTGAYIDKISKEDLTLWHSPRIQALISAGVDFIAAETLPSWREAAAILDAVSSAGGFTPVWVSFTLRDACTLPTGETLQEAVRHLRQHPLFQRGRVFALGINCCSPALISEAVDNIRQVTRTLPLVIYPNSCETWNAITRRWEGTEADWEEFIKDWMSKGVVGIGGCCRVGAAKIKSIRLAMAKVLVDNL